MFRIIILTTAALLFSAPLFAQAKGAHAKSKPAPGGQAAFTHVEQMPVFNGNLQDFLNATLHYPDSARAHNAEGRCAVGFVVMPTGRIDSVHIVRSAGNAYLDDEAVRVIKSMPDWKPGTQDGKPVPVRYTLPMTFKLDN